ncbi:DUF11 domain-containing protein, partial [Patescibacteria group bacterium]|nr:DUF11 domain-containing protein [Patescibacteria group bacterium]
LQVKSGEAWNQDVISAQTGSDGCYTFSNLGPGIYRVREVLTDVDLAGYFPTDNWTTEGNYRISGEMPMNSNDSLRVDYFNDLNPVKLELTKTSDKIGLTAIPGDPVNFELTVKNTASSSAYGVMVNDVLPIEFSYVTDSGQVEGVSQNPTINGSQLTWSLGTIAAGGSKKITYQAIIKSPLADGSYPNIAVSFGTNRPSGLDKSTSYSNFAFIYTAVGTCLSYSVSIGGGFVLGAAIGPQVLGAATGSPTYLLIIAILMILGGLLIYFKKGRKFHV